MTLNFGEENESQGKVKPFRQRVVVLLHLLFRVLAIITYLLCSVIGLGFVASFVSIVVLLSLDFWTTKNITGRLLAGLRWWNYVDEEGKSHWVFESRKVKGGGSGEQQKLADSNTAESRIFWLSLVGSEVVWFVFLFVSLVTFSIKWFMVSGMGVTLNGANMYGYVRCKLGSGENISKAATQFLGRQVLGSMLSGMTGANNTQQSTNSQK